MAAERKTVLFTGGTGFLGSHLLHRMVDSGFKAILLKRVSSNMDRIEVLLPLITVYDIEGEDLGKIFRDHAINLIIHCATNYGREDSDPCALLEANLFLPLTLLELGSRNRVSCFINTDTILDKRVSTYSLSKSQFKDWLRLYSTGLTCINVALEHFYGPNDDPSKFVTFVIRSLLQDVERIPLTGGEQKRDFIYIDDVVEAFYLIISRAGVMGNGFFDFEIGSGRTVTIRDFVTTVHRLVGAGRTLLDFGALPYREHEVMDSSVDISALRALGWHNATPLEEGLRKTITMERELR